jgi:hypothetical protein
MTTAEKRLTAKLLRMASDVYSCNGCNDFDLSLVIPDQDERDEFVRGYFANNGDPSEYYEQSEHGDGPEDWRIMDWMAMSFMADRLEREANDDDR